MSRIYSIFLISSFILVSSEITLDFSNSNWSFDSKNNVYYQISINYCTKVVSPTYQTMAFYVPG